MTDYLKAAYQRYSQNGDFIAPISKVDAQIITELIGILEKLGDIHTVEVLKEYKYNDDSEVLSALKEVRKQTKKIDVLADRMPHYINVTDKRIDLMFVFGYEALEIVNSTGGVTYGILLNPTPDLAKNIPYYSNYVLYFPNFEEAKYNMDIIDNYIRQVRGGFITDSAENDNESDNVSE